MVEMDNYFEIFVILYQKLLPLWFYDSFLAISSNNIFNFTIFLQLSPGLIQPPSLLNTHVSFLCCFQSLHF